MDQINKYNLCLNDYERLLHTFHGGRFADCRLKPQTQLAQSITTKHEQPPIFCRIIAEREV